jgi:hypothetical protein
MSTVRKKYDSTFKLESVRLADTSKKPDLAIEQELGLYQGAIRHWRDEDRSMHFDIQATTLKVSRSGYYYWTSRVTF